MPDPGSNRGSDQGFQIHLSGVLNGEDMTLSASLPTRGVLVLMGASGVGKTSLLNALCGLESPFKGRITHLGVPLHTRPIRHRPLTLMAQHAPLIPHLTVQRNLDFASETLDQELCQRLISDFQLTPLLQKKPNTLSGGQRRLVSFVQTASRRRDILLLDEPYAGLDAHSASLLGPWIRDLAQTRLVLMVLHDHDQAASLADQILTLGQGKLSGPFHPHFALSDPKSPLFSGQVLPEPAAVIDAALVESGVLSTLSLSGHLFYLPEPVASDHVRLRIRARDVAIATEKPTAISVQNILDGQIVAIQESAPPFVDVQVRLAGSTDQPVLFSRITVEAMEKLGLGAGQRVFLLIKAASFERGNIHA